MDPSWGMIFVTFCVGQLIVDAASVGVHFTLGAFPPLPARRSFSALARRCAHSHPPPPRAHAHSTIHPPTTTTPPSPSPLYTDNYFSPTTPGIGSAVHYFREHHKYPYLMLERDWIDTNAEITTACLGGCILMSLILQPFGILDSVFWNLVAGWGSLCGPTISSVHALTHLKNPPLWYKSLSYFGLVCTKEHHKKHHEAFRTCYSLYLGMVDGFFDTLRILEGIELFIYVAFGIIAVNTRLDHFMYLDGETTVHQRWRNACANWATAFHSHCASRAGVLTLSCSLGAAPACDVDALKVKAAVADALKATTTKKSKSSKKRITSALIEALDLELYRRVLAATSLRGKTIVDVGCGVGTSLVAFARGDIAASSNPNGSQSEKADAPTRAVGVDLSNVNIERAEFRHPPQSRPGCVEFAVAAAEKLPLVASSADVVLSVESTHALSEVALFVGEAQRVLRPGGRLCVADYGTEAHWSALLGAAKRHCFDVEEEEDITEDVLASLRASRDERMRLQTLSKPWFDFAACGALTEGASASAAARSLERGDVSYRRFVLVQA